MPETNREHSTRAEQHRLAAVAAEKATRWQDAVDEYEQCLTLLSAPEPHAEATLLTALGRCYWNLAEAKTAWRTLRRAISLYQQLGDGVGQARATVEILRIWGPPERHRQMAEDALAALGDADPYLRARLLLRLRWFDDDINQKLEEVIRIAEEHGFDDLLAERTDRDASTAIDEGRTEDAIRLRDEAHSAYARVNAYDSAGAMLRRAGFSTIEFGMLERGFMLSQRAFDYAMDVHLNGAAQLALMDMAGVMFARGEFQQCEELLARSPGQTDFRADLYRVWLAEARGDMDVALRMMVSPERGGNAPPAMALLHAAAGTMSRSGREDAARQALQAWADVPRGWEEDICYETPALLDCLIASGDDVLVRRVYAAFAQRDQRSKAPFRFSTLVGRAFAPTRGAIALKLGHIAEAEHHYREGLEWCETQRCVRDADLCRNGLIEARARGMNTASS
jgi:tetratricopeptide (TPR) repeat protein